MDTTDLLTKFARIGARLRVADRPTRRSRVPLGAISLDVQADRGGEFFEVVAPGGGDPEVAVLDVRPADRHLLLMVRDGGEKHKYLCGHDERHWFVAAVPDAAPVGTVLQAKEALKPAEVRSAQASKRLGAEAGNRRKNAAYRRQGEWFFLPAPGFVVDEALVLRNEPLRRGDGGKPHWTESCYRTGGETVHVSPGTPTGSRCLDTSTSSPRTRRRRAGTGKSCVGIPACTSGAASAMPTTRRSSCTAGTASS